jgi:signal transduction histidine kinase
MTLGVKVLRRDPGRVGMWVLWTVFTGAYVVFFYLFNDAREIADAEIDGYLEVVLLGVPLIVMFGATVWMAETDVDRSLHYRVVVWTLGVSVLFLVAVMTALFVLDPRYDRGEHLLMLLMSAGFGASMGTVTGVVEARSIHYGRAQERAVVEARRRRREQRRLEYLNQYLRHEVLNEVNKINGYAQLVEARIEDGDVRDWVRVIERSSGEVGTFIASIRSIMNDEGENLDVRPSDVTAVAEATADRIGTTGGGATVTVDAPGPVYAAAGDLLDRVFVNLVENAVSHCEEPTVQIVICAQDGGVTVRISDDGPGIPEAIQETLFDPPESGDHGYGLFLSQHLVELYGGRLELGETGAEGTTFEMRLEAATRENRPNGAVTTAAGGQPA